MLSGVDLLVKYITNSIVWNKWECKQNIENIGLTKLIEDEAHSVIQLQHDYVWISDSKRLCFKISSFDRSYELLWCITTTARPKWNALPWLNLRPRGALRMLSVADGELMKYDRNRCKSENSNSHNAHMISSY